MANPDTIVAVGTPPGTSALAVIRLSGSKAFDLLQGLCPDLDPLPDTRRATLTRVLSPVSGELIDQVLVTTFQGPESYTGEDMVEVSSHGGWLSPSSIREAAVFLGARQAQEGEFTRRAYLNGKMDLLQVEAVLDLIEGRSQVLHRSAVHQLERGLSLRIGALREGLVQLEALLVHHLDFPEEDEPPIPADAIARNALALEGAMELLLKTAPEGELLREGALTVLAGRPNSGKSSLFNALVGEDRAIVTEIPGTTRDALEAVVSLGGFPFRLVDTAGLRETEERIEVMGIEVARRYLEKADLILFCAEAGRPLEAEEGSFLEKVTGTSTILVRTKADLKEVVTPAGEVEGEIGEEFVGRAEVSVETGEGLDTLKEALPALVYGGLVSQAVDVPVLTRARHSRGVRTALEEVRSFRMALERGLPAEVAATHLRPAETALEELLGVIPREEILDRLFREFCIGK
jgi:tRNA modification GTPase